MTTPAKQYQNIAFKEIMFYSQQNPNRHRILEPIEIHVSRAVEDPSLASLGLHGYVSTNMNPSGVLSVLACVIYPAYYSLCQKNNRQLMITELATSLQTGIDELKQTAIARKRKKIYELIGSAFNGSPLQDKDYLDLYQGIHYLRQIQFILLKEAIQEKTEHHDETLTNNDGFKGEIHFSSNPSTWKRDVPIWIVDYKAHWVAVPVDVSTEHIYSMAGDWLCEMEQRGWVIEWPEVEGTKTELVDILSRSADWKEDDKKRTKEVLACRLGKQQVLRQFQKWNLSSSEDSI
jgi:hypothetical protein